MKKSSNPQPQKNKIFIGKGIHKTTEIIVKKQNGQLALLMYRPTDNTKKAQKIRKKCGYDFAVDLSHELSVGDKVILKNKNYPNKIKGIVIAIFGYDWNYDKPSGVKNRMSNVLGTNNWIAVYKKYRNQQKKILNIKRRKYSIAIKYISLCAELELNPIKDFTRINKKVQVIKKVGHIEINDILVEDKILNAYRKFTNDTNIVNPKVYISLAKQFSLSVEQVRKIIQSYIYYK